MLLKKIIIGLMCLAPAALVAQTGSELKFGHLNSQEILVLMPQTKEALAKLEALQVQYENELKTQGTKLETLYAEYTQLKDVPADIKESREREIMELQQRIENIRKTAAEQLESAQKKEIEPIIELIKKAIEEVGAENGFFYIYDLSVPVIVYKSAKSVDVTPLLRKKLNIPANATPVNMQ